MLDDLPRLHARMLACLDELDQLTRQAAPPMERLPAVRLDLTRASRARTMLLDRHHLDLLNRVSAAGRAQIEQLKAVAKQDLIVSANHIGAWTLREIAARWPDYCAASNDMRRAMRDRIAREKKLIYPLLDRGGKGAEAA